MVKHEQVKTQPWHWLPMIPLHVFTSVKKARKFVKAETGFRYETSGKSGSLTLYEHDTARESFAVMHIMKGPRDAHWYALLAHECVHYAQYVERFANTKLDDETEAYVVQAAMVSALDQLGEIS